MKQNNVTLGDIANTLNELEDIANPRNAVKNTLDIERFFAASMTLLNRFEIWNSNLSFGQRYIDSSNPLKLGMLNTLKGEINVSSRQGEDVESLYNEAYNMMHDIIEEFKERIMDRSI